MGDTNRIPGELLKALLNEFNRTIGIDEMRRILRFELDVNYYDIVNHNRQSAAYFDIIDWAEKNGRLSKLARTAPNYFPGNEQFRKNLNIIANEIDHCSNVISAQYFDWESVLPEIDFSEAMKIFDLVFNNFGMGGGAVSFLIHNEHWMGGELCVERIIKQLENSTSLLRRDSIRFFSHTPLKVETLLARLGQYWQCKPFDEKNASDEYLRRYALNILDRIEHSVGSNSTILFEIVVNTNINGFYDQFLPQFLEHCWHPFVESLPKIIEKHPKVKLVTVILVNAQKSTSPFPENLFCSINDFDNRRFVQLPLQLWTLDDLYEWLINNNMTYWFKTNDKVKEFAINVFQNSEGGRPSNIHHSLKKELPEIIRKG